AQTRGWLPISDSMGSGPTQHLTRQACQGSVNDPSTGVRPIVQTKGPPAKPAGFESSTRTPLLQRLADRHSQLRQALDLAFELVAGDGRGDARRRAGHDDVAGLECHHL